MGHSRPDTTQQYTDEVAADELAEALQRAANSRTEQASPDWTTLDQKSQLSFQPWSGGGGIEPAQDFNRFRLAG
jgi:hypothetical protein